jgi:hypothetical protein
MVWFSLFRVIFNWVWLKPFTKLQLHLLRILENYSDQTLDSGHGNVSWGGRINQIEIGLAKKPCKLIPPSKKVYLNGFLLVSKKYEPIPFNLYVYICGLTLNIIQH